MRLITVRQNESHEIFTTSTKEIYMANPRDKAAENIPGRYYNDTSCIDCDQCRELAPQFFKRHDDGGYTYVYRQPVTPEEVALAEDALQSAPPIQLATTDDGKHLLA
jgi:ferredoxin